MAALSQTLLGQVKESVFSWHVGSGNVTNHSSHLRALDPLTLTATQCQKMLAAGTTSTLELVEWYLDQIRQHNHDGIKLNAVISTAPIEVLTQQAKRLDEERTNGKAKGPLHGVPIIIKDSILTDSDLGMDTTCGSFALVGAKAKNAPVVNAILKAGMIILGKANLSEWAGAKGFGLTTGWSAVGGQTQSPYVRGGFTEGDKLLGHSAPGGSSSGSAAAVAAGFAPLSLATETDGSITQPAGRASLYGMKVTVGALSTEGTLPLSPLTDSLGGMAKTTEDLAALIGVLMETDYSPSLRNTWEGQRVAWVDPLAWELHPVVCNRNERLQQKQKAEVDERITTMENSGAHVVKDVVLPQCSELTWEGEDALEVVWNHDYKNAMEKFLAQYAESPIRTVEEVIQFNKDHKEQELPPAYPGQQQLEMSLHSTLTPSQYDEIVKFIRLTAKTNGFDRIFAEQEVDLLMGPLDGRIVTVAAAAGYPAGVVPLGFADDFNGRAYGVTIVAKAGREDRIFEAMSAWEKTMPGRKPPPLLRDWNVTKATSSL